MNPSRLWTRLAVAMLFLVPSAGAVPALAEVTQLTNLPAPIVRVNVQRGDVTIRTWNRPVVAVDGDPSLIVTQRQVRPRAEDHSVLIPQALAQTRDGPVQLPPESFVTSSIPPGPYSIVVVRTSSPANVGSVTVHVPADSPFLFAHTTDGSLRIHDYQAGTLLAFVGRGRVTLDHVGGTAFAQTNRGPIIARDSNFARVRARSLLGNLTFERCNVGQIQATTVAGSIVYDAGSFAPGLARFESTSGNVAVGASGAAQIAGRADAGHVFTDFPNGARIAARGNTASATVGAGGPVVTATTQTGDVYLYSGSLRDRPALPPAWRPALQTLDAPAERLRDSPSQARGALERSFTVPSQVPRMSEPPLRSFTPAAQRANTPLARRSNPPAPRRANPPPNRHPSPQRYRTLRG